VRKPEHSTQRGTGRVLVTGAEGFTGRYLVSALQAQGWETLSGVRASNAGTGAVSFDLNDAASMVDVLKRIQPTQVIHLAAISFAAHDDLEQIYTTNVIGTLNLLAAIETAQLELEHLILASSAAVYGQQELAELHEQLTPQPRSDYGISKLAAEHIALARHTAQQLTITRPFNYTGVNQHPSFLIPKLVSHFVEKKPVIELGNLDVAREFNDVRWAADWYTALVSSSDNPRNREETVNLCTGQAFTLREVIGLLTEISGHSLEIAVNPQFVRDNDPPLIKGETRKSKALGLPLPVVDLKDTLTWMCDNYSRPQNQSSSA